MELVTIGKNMKRSVVEEKTSSSSSIDCNNSSIMNIENNESNCPNEQHLQEKKSKVENNSVGGGEDDNNQDKEQKKEEENKGINESDCLGMNLTNKIKVSTEDESKNGENHSMNHEFNDRNPIKNDAPSSSRRSLKRTQAFDSNYRLILRKTIAHHNMDDVNENSPSDRQAGNIFATAAADIGHTNKRKRASYPKEAKKEANADLISDVDKVVQPIINVDLVEESLDPIINVDVVEEVAESIINADLVEGADAVNNVNGVGAENNLQPIVDDMPDQFNLPQSNTFDYYYSTRASMKITADCSKCKKPKKIQYYLTKWPENTCVLCKTKLTFSCNICKQIYSTYAEARNHVVQICDPDNTFFCNFCNFKCTNESEMIHHTYRNHQNKRVSKSVALN